MLGMAALFAGEMGYELHVPSESAVAVYEALMAGFDKLSVKEGFWPHWGSKCRMLGSAGRRRAPDCSPRAPRGREDAPRCWEIAPKLWKNCSEILSLGLGIWTLDKQSGAWHRLLRALAPLSGAWISNWDLRDDRGC